MFIYKLSHTDAHATPSRMQNKLPYTQAIEITGAMAWKYFCFLFPWSAQIKGAVLTKATKDRIS